MEKAWDDFSEAQQRLARECDDVREALLGRNLHAGLTAPIGIFYHADAVAQLRTRIDDRLGILMRGGEAADPFGDNVLDLVGYLILLRAVVRARRGA